MSKICRLCLQSGSESYYNIDKDDYRLKMQSVIPEININIVKEPLICEKCSDLLLSAYSFKSNCLQTEEDLKTYAKDDGNQLKLEDFLRQRNEDLSSAQIVESCTQDVNPDDDLFEKKVEDTSRVIYDNLSQKENNLKQEVNLKDTHEIVVVETLIEPKHEKKPTDERVTGTSLQQKRKIIVNKCPICNKIFLRKSSFEAHLRRHKPGEVPVSSTVRKQNQKSVQNKCNICNKVFLLKKGLDTHLKTYKHYQCTVCNSVRPCKTTLEEHMRVHTGERPHHCKYCGKSFAQSSTLYTHVHSIHMSERPYICEICGMSFPVCAAYTAHKKRRHDTVEKKFVCSFCGKGFRIKSTLDMHVRWHTGERPYSCQVCGKRFVSSNSVTRHMRIHNGVRPFECPLCQKTFTQNHNMKIHLNSCSRRDTRITEAK